MRARPNTEAIRITPAEARTLLAALEHTYGGDDGRELDTGLDDERLERLADEIRAMHPDYNR